MNINDATIHFIQLALVPNIYLIEQEQALPKAVLGVGIARCCIRTVLML